MTGAAVSSDLFTAIKTAANGLLPVDVYRQLYAFGQAGGTFVEIGTAHGAATIALALGAKHGGRPFHIYTADPFAGKYSSRTRYGSVEQNVEIVRAQFRHFEVDADITLVVGGSAELVEAHDPREISLLMLDADGRIDRDLAILFERLAPQSRIVIDDIDNQIVLRRSENRVVIDQKHRTGALLTDEFIKHGLLVEEMRSHNTGFFRKGSAPGDAAHIDAISLPVYRELVFGEGSPLPKRRRRRRLRTAKRWLTRSVPGVRTAYHSLRSTLIRSRKTRPSRP